MQEHKELAMDITRKEHLEAIKEGVKEAFLEAMEAGDGYSRPIILEPILDAIEKGTRHAIYDIQETKETFEMTSLKGNDLLELLQKLNDNIEILSTDIEGLSTEIYKYRKDNNTDPLRIML